MADGPTRGKTLLCYVEELKTIFSLKKTRLLSQVLRSQTQWKVAKCIERRRSGWWAVQDTTILARLGSDSGLLRYWYPLLAFPHPRLNHFPFPSPPKPKPLTLQIRPLLLHLPQQPQNPEPSTRTNKLACFRPRSLTSFVPSSTICWWFNFPKLQYTRLFFYCMYRFYDSNNR